MVGLGSDAGIEEAKWLESLSDHAIFTPLQGNSSRPQCMAIRNTDLIVANGRSLRITSLSDVKHRSTSSTSPSSSSSSSYKELISDVLDFDIVEAILNPTGKLLAVVGNQRIAVVVLPRSGIYSSKTIGKQISVKAAPVGSFYYHERVGGRARLACVKWHPWGQLGSSLLVMSKDGLLREFDVSSDVQEPTQTVSLLPSASKSQQTSRSASYSRRSLSRHRSQTPNMRRSRRSTSRFALDDDDEDDENSDGTYVEETYKRHANSGPAAVSFTLGLDQRGDDDAGVSSTAASWTAFTIFSVCTNGDVYSLCPFMPKTSLLSLSFLRQLPSLISSSDSSAMTSASIDVDLQTRYITSLLKQVKHKRQDRQSSLSPSRSRRSVSATPMSLDPRASAPPEEEEDSVDLLSETFVIQAPASTVILQTPLPQGPFLLHPAPIELSEDHENTSADLFYSHIVSDKSALDVLGIVGDDGRIDVCLLLEPIEPRWASFNSSRSSKGSRRVASSGRYALSDSDSDEYEELQQSADSVEALPRLFVYETIDLGLAQSTTLADTSMAPRFILDPFYPDTIYVQHSLGAHVLSIGKWSKSLLSAMDLPEAQRGQAMERGLHQSIATDVVQAVDTSATSSQPADHVVGLCIVSDIYLSYSFMAVTRSGAVVALELGLRIDGEASSAIDSMSAPSLPILNGPSLYTSLLGDGSPFTPPEPFKMLNGMPYHPRTAIKGKQSKEEIRVTPESLRNLGNIVSSLRGEMRKIVQGSNTVQSRLDLQDNELHRQLKKLSEAKNRADYERKREEAIEKRIANVVSTQQRLAKRSDWLLQKLVENHSPEISIYEARWLQELERLELEVGRKGDEAEGAGEGLQGRVSKLKYQLEVLRPALIKAKEKKANQSGGQFGESQLQAIEGLLAKEAELLTTDRNMITTLQAKMQRQTAMY